MAVSNTIPTFLKVRTGFISELYHSGVVALAPLASGKMLGVDAHHLHRYNADGSTDLSFDFDGSLSLNINSDGSFTSQQLARVHPMADGKMLISGTAAGATRMLDYSFVLVKLNADSSTDTSFGNGTGMISTNLAPGRMEYAPVTTVLADGRIMVAAGAWELSPTGGSTTSGMHVLLARYLADGSPDTSFGIGGVVTGSSDRARPEGMTVQADGKIVVVGTDITLGYGQSFVVHRFNADGSVDNTFGIGGKVDTLFEPRTYRNASASNVAIQADGKIVVIGSAPLLDNADPRIQTGMAVVRYNTDGSLDTSFGNGGKLVYWAKQDQGRTALDFREGYASSWASEIHIAGDGKILIGGSSTLISMGISTTEFALLRLLPDGRLDEQFGNMGVATAAAATPSNLSMYAMHVRTDGSILVGGAMSGSQGGSVHNVLVGFNANGSVDTGFGSVSTVAQNDAIYRVNWADQFLHARMQVSDAELDAAASYAGASVTLARAGGADANDVFGAGAALRFANGRIVLDGVDIGAVSNIDGTLRLVFGSGATQSLVNRALQSITYDNSSAVNGQGFRIDWTFSDGGVPGQAGAAALSASFSTLVTASVVPVPQVPTTMFLDLVTLGDKPHATVKLHGQAPVGAQVEVWSGATFIGSTVAVAGRKWEMVLTDLKDGSHDFRAVTVPGAGVEEMSSAIVQHVRDTTAPEAPLMYALQYGDDSHTYRIVGYAEAGSTVALSLNGAGIGTYTASATGEWEHRLRLTEATSVLAATATDSFGNRSLAAAELRIVGDADDFSANTSTIASLAVDGSAKGALEASGDKDWFRITLDELTVYRFTLAGATVEGGASYPEFQLRLWDPRADNGKGGFVAVYEKTGDPFMTVAVLRSGEYFLEASTNLDTGAYTVSALTYARDDYHGYHGYAGNAALGTVIKGSLETGGDVDSFRFAVEAGKTYSVVLTTGAGPNVAHMRTHLSDEAGTFSLYSQGAVGEELTTGFTPRADGNYYLSVDASSYSAAGSNYSVSMVAARDDYLASTATTAKLPIFAIMSAKIDIVGDRDWFKIALTAGTSYTFKLSGLDNSISALALFDATGTGISLNTMEYVKGAMAVFKPTVSGTYFIEASGTRAGSYNLQTYVTEVDDHASTFAGAAAIVPGQRVTGRLALSNDADWFKIAVKAGYGYTFTVDHLGSEWKTSDPINLALVDANGAKAATGSYSGKTTMTFQAVRDGEYYVQLASNQGIGGYALNTAISAKDSFLASQETTGSIVAGGLIRSALEIIGDSDWIKVELIAGQKFRFELTGVRGQGGTLVSPSLTLVDSNGRSVENARDNGPGGDPLISYTAPTSGTYFLEVRGSGGSGANGVGSYTLKMASSTIDFADTMAPVVVLTTMPTLAYAPGPAADLKFTFNESIVPGSGTIHLLKADGTLVESFNMATSTRVKIDSSGRTLLVDPTDDLLPSTDYKVELGVAAVKDLVGLALATSSTYTFRTGEPMQNLVGTSGNDVFVNGTGYDTINGGAGTDSVVFPQWSSSDYQITFRAYNGDLAVQSSAGPSFTHDDLIDIERLIFTDKAIAYDLSGAAGKVYRLYQAAFDRAPDMKGMGFWLSQVDSGASSLSAVASAFVNSAEFSQLFGANLSNAAFVTAMYGNVLNRAPDTAGLNYWTTALGGGTTREEMLMMFSESAENKAIVIGAIAEGISYLPYY